AASDHDRRLTQRGTLDAAEAGEWARSAGVLPDHACVSTAARAHETWSAFSAAADLDVVPELEPALYSAGPDAAIEILRTAPAAARTLMIVGHNPTMAQLVHLLDDGGADPTTFAEIAAGLPTCAVAVLEVPGEWSGLEIGCARITAFHVGRG
ncbi:MAG: histidine phosphatase family protein, partial [Propionibacteriales bacterium]|nr:histidine phosphatase family protein [Propionibacteriales bacterium]